MNIKNFAIALSIVAALLFASESSPGQTGAAKRKSDRGSTLKMGEYLEVGEYLLSEPTTATNRILSKLILQTDGNLVLYMLGSVTKQINGKTTHGWDYVRPLWSSNTAGKPTKNAVMQTDGNLVLYTHNGKAIWNSGTQGKQNAKLVLQNDGNLVIYGAAGKLFSTALWSTRTGQY